MPSYCVQGQGDNFCVEKLLGAQLLCKEKAIKIAELASLLVMTLMYIVQQAYQACAITTNRLC